jgi:hypothetical protein
MRLRSIDVIAHDHLMHIHYAQIGSDSGPFVFIRLPNIIDQSKHDIARWARLLSAQHFAGLPVVVHNHDEQNDEILTVFPPEFHSAVASMTGAGVFLSTMQVVDIP